MYYKTIEYPFFSRFTFETQSSVISPTHLPLVKSIITPLSWSYDLFTRQTKTIDYLVGIIKKVNCSLTRTLITGKLSFVFEKINK